MMQMQYKPASAKEKLKSILSNVEKYDATFINATIEVINSLYPTELEKEMFLLLKSNVITIKQFAAIGSYLLQSKKLRTETVKIIQKKIKEHEQNFLENRVEKKDATMQLQSNYLQCLGDMATTKWKPTQATELIYAIVAKKYLANKNLIISFQNRNRATAGLAVVRDSTGKFYTEKDELFCVPQLARAITNLPFFISNGNTPQGLFAITGFGNSKNMHIGPTDNIQLIMPFEQNMGLFIHQQDADSTSALAGWNELFYDAMPLKFQSILKESMLASAVGRTEIIAHGTTVDPTYYKNKPYHGFTPTMGCLQAKEIWNYQTGERVYSDQQKLVNAFKAIGATKGYLLVVDIRDSNQPIDLNTVKRLLKL
jgi:hypothetical protein